MEDEFYYIYPILIPDNYFECETNTTYDEGNLQYVRDFTADELDIFDDE